MTTELLTSLLNLAGIGGIITAVYVLLKVRPEAGQIVVTTAQNAVIVQSGVIDELNNELKRLRDTIRKLEGEIRHLEKVNDNCEATLRAVARRIAHLEERLEIQNQEVMNQQELLDQQSDRNP